MYVGKCPLAWKGILEPSRGFGNGNGSEETHIGAPAYTKVICASTALFRSLPPPDDSGDSDNDNNNCQGDYTSFDIRCAGLSPNTFTDIGGDLATYCLRFSHILISLISVRYSI